MTTVAYCHPLVPAEWIAAHGLQPRWMHPQQSRNAVAVRGMCPYAAAVVDTGRSGLDVAALVLTTVCDQMRYGAAVLDRHARMPVFLFNVPSTWQTTTAWDLYREEIRRLGQFLVSLGGASPSDEELGRRMLAFDAARATLMAARDRLSARQLAEEMIRVRSACLPSPACERGAGGEGGVRIASPATIPLAIVGGPLVEKDFELFEVVERLGGRVALDATEGGTRMLPAPFDSQRVVEDPLGELVRAYFATTPDVFRRPNDPLYTWLAHQFRDRGVRGVLFRRYVWCDLWHAELVRLRQWSPVPVLEIDVNHDDHGVPPRIAGRVEAFLEMLR